MKRRHLVVSRIRYIGKEANEVEEREAFGEKEDSCMEYRRLPG